jgi:hypothetical protein
MVGLALDTGGITVLRGKRCAAFDNAALKTDA